MTKATHYLVVTYPSWAHVRTQIALTNSLLQLNPDLHVTMLIPAKRSKAVALEMAQYDAVSGDRLRTIHYGTDEQVEVGGMWNPHGGFREECQAQLYPFTDAIVKRESMTDPITGEQVIPHDLPYDIIISDVTLIIWSNKVKQQVSELTGKAPRLINSCPYDSAFLLFFLPLNGDYHRRLALAADGAAGDSKKFQELAAEHILNNSDIKDDVPGLWPVHFYETCPVAKESMLNFGPMVARMIGLFHSYTDAFIVSWPKGLGEEAQADLDRHFKHVYQVGPQLPPVVRDEWSVEAKQGECKEYLDSSPERSVIYISFGSVLYAPSLDQIGTLLDVFEEIGSRYIIAEGNAPAEIKTMLRSRVGQGLDKGLFVTWAPQRAILSHKATKLFVTHGGSNSAMEAMLFKVPMIQWPSSR
ncbi:hypothetical protein BD324DRAFT_322110 [Kockovaella imperatae]|uniref:UDP-glycosyltransferases domain-containing protein n=1 Tax=Kockovaella imperatae TaxID=4999 RepID=A0A1Y1UMN6_9TREE|nr:hypothetical protein BD324DRAFT_322110 [Kockovaella imperatae]ORX39269.1 hypothetical protein BD324DRAFT_322110 [Kockovaella imperatae]